MRSRLSWNGIIASKNRNVKYLLCFLDVFAKYPWVKPLKSKKSKTVPNTFIGILNETNCKPSKLWADQGK